MPGPPTPVPRTYKPRDPRKFDILADPLALDIRIFLANSPVNQR